MNPIERIEAVMGMNIRYSAELSKDGVYSMYTITTEENKFLFDVKVDHDTKIISIIYPDTTEAITAGKAVMKSIITIEGATYRPSADSVKVFLYPRLAKFIADYYVP